MGLADITVKEGTALQLGQKGRLTITDTNIHYGKFISLQMLEDTVFTTITDGLNTLANGLAFSSGGTTEVVAGDFLRGATSGAIVQVKSLATLTSGTWAGGDALGSMICEPLNTTGTTAAENMDLVTIAPVADGATTIPYTVKTSNVLTTASEANGGVTTGDAQAGVTYLAGTTIFGMFTKLQLASGSIEAYKG